MAQSRLKLPLKRLRFWYNNRLLTPCSCRELFLLEGVDLLSRQLPCTYPFGLSTFGVHPSPTCLFFRTACRPTRQLPWAALWLISSHPIVPYQLPIAPSRPQVNAHCLLLLWPAQLSPAPVFLPQTPSVRFVGCMTGLQIVETGPGWVKSWQLLPVRMWIVRVLLVLGTSANSILRSLWPSPKLPLPPLDRNCDPETCNHTRYGCYSARCSCCAVLSGSIPWLRCHRIGPHLHQMWLLCCHWIRPLHWETLEGIRYVST